MSIRKIEFWAVVPTGRLTAEQAYYFPFYRDEDHFSEIVDADLDKWVADLPVNGELIDEYGWTDRT